MSFAAERRRLGLFQLLGGGLGRGSVQRQTEIRRRGRIVMLLRLIEPFDFHRRSSVFNLN
jgi:hypothetical protein